MWKNHNPPIMQIGSRGNALVDGGVAVFIVGGDLASCGVRKARLRGREGQLPVKTMLTWPTMAAYLRRYLGEGIIIAVLFFWPRLLRWKP
jgi:hypothetical protein